jgi:hypothetical protein
MRTNYAPEEIMSWPEGTKKCWGCKELKALGAFHVMKQGLYGVNTYCKDCRKPKSRKQYKSLPFEKTMWQSAKSRAQKSGKEFTIAVEDIVIPELCPIFKQPIILVRHSVWAPSLDRKDSTRGYTPDNIEVMSKRANTLKNNASAAEMKMVLKYLEENESSVVIYAQPAFGNG